MQVQVRQSQTARLTAIADAFTLLQVNRWNKVTAVP